MSISKEGINENILQKAGYKCLGWLNCQNMPAEYHECIHNPSEISYSQTKNLCYCDICKIYWFYDCSD